MRILLRCDGAPRIGVGHVVRSLALAQVALERGHSVDLLGRAEGALLESLTGATPGLTMLGAAREGVGLGELATGYDVVHVDHYDLGVELLADLATVAGADRAMLSNIVDGRFGARPADVLVDPTVGAERDDPPAAARWHLRGSRFTPVRSELTRGPTHRPAAATTPADERVPTVLVVMGGTDPSRCAPLVVEALEHLHLELEVTVVSVPGTAEALATLAAGWARGRLRVTPPVPDLPALMAAADVVVTAAGTSTWELCAMRRPMALVVAADNQRAGHDRVVAAGGAVGLGGVADLTDVGATAARLRPLLADADLRDRVAAAAHRLVDGRGAWRVVSAWEAARAASEPRPGPAVTVRRATLDDARALWEWRNDPVTRAVSRHHDVVPYADHVAWLRASLERPDRHVLVGGHDGVDVGTVRWDLEEGAEWEVSIVLAPGARGRGLAPGLLRAGEQWLSGGTAVDAYLAVVHTDNTASRRLFVSGGYVPDLPPDAHGFERWVRTVR
ncbi:MAG TPA: bifunctional UDP-2,4-diacetamido-2,4,6-trideoxy-beta-L-altropyranose hydrolase/GNAT family N-acetyltransferase [Ornithinibacter sp.]|nr:bifunctional UDP-2,4-diacetamido-2,4,6-trideoxy-beta-L-altropyranose hydrolase/GNAT family N-acetyltransferase [Ornithinibacter sp.]